MSLFARLVTTSALSPLFARRALHRALERAGVQADRLRPDDVATAAPEIERVIRMFLPERADEIMRSIRKLSSTN
jgi:hypothetical protein